MRGSNIVISVLDLHYIYKITKAVEFKTNKDVNEAIFKCFAGFQDLSIKDILDKTSTLTSPTKGPSASKTTSPNVSIPPHGIPPPSEIEGQPELLKDCVEYNITKREEKEQEYQKARNIGNENAKDVAKKNDEKNRYINILPYNFNELYWKKA